MSIRIMSQVWESGPDDKAEILVLLALADYCNDAGECWPAVARSAKKARMSVRGVQTVTARLVESGWLEIDPGNGRKNCNNYRIKTPQPLHPAAPAPPPENPAAHDINPAPGAENPAPGADKPSRTIKNRQSKNKNVRVYLVEVAGGEAVDSFMAYRRGHKSKALTETGAKRLATHLREIRDSGGDPDDALALAEERGWASVQPDWYFKMKGQNHEPTCNKNDPALRAIADAATAF